MTRPPRLRSRAEDHLDAGRMLDLLDDRLPLAALRAAQEHLAVPCPRCREQMRQVGLLVERMRRDRVPEVPEALRRRGLDAFVPHPSRGEGRRLATRLAELIFDSLAQPLAAPARRAVGDARRLRYRLGGVTLELELEPEGARAFALRGRLGLDEPALHRIELAGSGERRTLWPDAAGRFAAEGLPAGRLTVAVIGPAARFRVPPISL